MDYDYHWLSKSHPTLLLSLIARISPTKLSRPRTSIQRDTTRATEWRCHGFLGEIFAPHLQMSTYMKFHNLEGHDGWHLFFACHPGFGAPGGQALSENPYRIVNSQASVTSLKLASKMSRTLASSAKPSERELRQEDHFGNSRQQKGISKTQLWNIKKRVVSDLQACRHCPRIRSVLIHTFFMTYGASHCAIILNETFKTTRWSEYLVLSYPFCICPSRLFHPFPRLQYWYNFLIPRLLNPWILVRWVSQNQARKKPQWLTALQHEMPWWSQYFVSLA